MRSLARIAAPAVVAAVVAACEGLLTEPAPIAPDLRVDLSVPAAAPGDEFGDLTGVFPLVRGVHFRFVHDGGERDTVVAGVEGDDTLRARVTLRPEELQGWLEIHTELRNASQQPLFRGLALLLPDDLSPHVDIRLTPVAGSITVGVPPAFDAVGDTTAMGAQARFANRTPIVGAVIEWASDDPTIVEVLSGDRIVSRGNGVATLTGSALGASGDFQVRVTQSPVLLTGVGPADTTIALGSNFQARPFGEDANGYPLLPGANVDWAGRGAVSVNTIGQVVAVAVGTGYVDVTHGTTVHTAQVTVTP